MKHVKCPRPSWLDKSNLNDLWKELALTCREKQTGTAPLKRNNPETVDASVIIPCKQALTTQQQALLLDDEKRERRETEKFKIALKRLGENVPDDEEIDVSDENLLDKPEIFQVTNVILLF